MRRGLKNSVATARSSNKTAALSHRAQVQHQRGRDLDRLSVLQAGGVRVPAADRAWREEHHLHHLRLLRRPETQLAHPAGQHLRRPR